MNTKNTISIALVALAVILLVTFILQNTDIVIVNFLSWTFAPSVAALIVFTFIIGILCGVTVDIILSIINKKKNKAVNNTSNNTSNSNSNKNTDKTSNNNTSSNITEIETFQEVKDNTDSN